MLDGYEASSADEARDLARLRELIASGLDPYDRRTPLHVTGSALVVHPATGRVLLRWHARQQGWLQVGGHGDPGERDAFEVALREAIEETGLLDLTSWPPPPGDSVPAPLHLVAVPVASRHDEPAHEHLDIRYLLATDRPDAARAETHAAPVAWLSRADALERAPDNLRETLRRLDAMIAQSAGTDVPRST